MLLPLTDDRTKRASPYARLLTKSVCFLGLLAFFGAVNLVKSNNPSPEGALHLQEGRRLEEDCEEPEGQGALVVVFILVSGPGLRCFCERRVVGETKRLGGKRKFWEFFPLLTPSIFFIV